MKATPHSGSKGKGAGTRQMRPWDIYSIYNIKPEEMKIRMYFSDFFSRLGHSEGNELDLRLKFNYSSCRR